MANIPKREPCVKCNNPVFFAERLVINASLYHRTCFKCARCSSVLTLGSYYETENDHEYCCETCPDEEKVNKAKVDESNRLSIAQRIALFEKETSSVLKKSLSDEEKSKSLNRQAPVNSAPLNNFLTTQIDGSAPSDCEEEKTIESNSSDSESEDEEHPSDDFIPTISDKSVTISDHKLNSKTPDNFVVTKELTKVEGIADSAATNSESQIDIASAHVVVVDKIVPEASPFHDDIELEFEKLAEEALVPVSVAKNTAPKTVTNNVQEVKIEESAKAVEVQEPMKDIAVKETIPEKIEGSTKINANEKEDSIVEKPVAPVSVVVEAATPTVEKSDAFDDGQVEASEILLESTEEVQIEQSKENESDYPDDLNPFGDDEENPESENSKVETKDSKRPSLNPFGSCSEDEEEDKVTKSSYGTLPKPPRPPPPKTMTLKAVSTNPFGSDDEDEEPAKPLALRTPVPTPRKPFLTSATPEPSPRSLSNQNSPGHSFKGSTSSLSSSTDGMSLRRKKKPAPPPPVLKVEDVSEAVKTPSTTPRKKRPAPTPPTSTPKPTQEPAQSLYITASDFPSDDPQSTLNTSLGVFDDSIETSSIASAPLRRLIPLEECLKEEGTMPQTTSEETVTYRRKIVPLSPKSINDETFDNLESSKDNKEAENRQRQSQGSLVSMRAGSESTDSLPYLNKSSHGKWKRRKGPAPALPGYLTNSQPQRRILQMLPMQEIRQELEVIEVQQQGLEKQGVMLEKMIRERCEGSGDNRTTEELLEQLPSTKNPKGVEELILQLFELVNEKNELFRRQAELMYLRRAHRLEEEQADVEYEIRTLMAQPEQNKTDSDKTKEEALIARLVEIVQLRNEVVDCLDRDRLREAEEDLSIKQRMESHTAKLDQDYLNQTPTKLSKKEKKKLKEAKKLKNKKLDADKDLDTSEMKSETTEKKKKKKKFLF